MPKAGGVNARPGAIVVAPDGVTTLESVDNRASSSAGCPSCRRAWQQPRRLQHGRVDRWANDRDAYRYRVAGGFGLLLMSRWVLPTVNIRRVPFKARGL